MAACQRLRLPNSRDSIAANPTLRRSQPFVCPLDHQYEIPSWSRELQWREHSFFSNPQAPPSLLANAVTVQVGTPAVPPVADAGSAPARTVSLARGVTFADAVAAITASPTAQAADVLSLDSADLGRLCRCASGLSDEATALAKKLPSLLSHSYDFCETTDNEYFVACKKTGRAGCRKHEKYIMNVTKGMEVPPPLPTSGCGGAASGCLAYQVPSEQTHTIDHRWCSDGDRRRPCDIRVLSYKIPST